MWTESQNVPQISFYYDQKCIQTNPVGKFVASHLVVFQIIHSLGKIAHYLDIRIPT